MVVRMADNESVAAKRGRRFTAIGALAGWAGEGKIKNQIDVVEGLENAPDALRRLFTGENLGKQLVKIADQ